MKIIIVLIGVLLCIVLLFFFCAFKISSQISREEEYLEEISNTDSSS